jgi:acyl phosphate:glycerol-3-phosphate acyltransferase
VPHSWIVVVLAAVVGFFVGAVNPATIVARLRHGDLRLGSGNPGATNTGRLLGLRWGLLVGALDVLKGLLPTLLALWWFDRFTAYAVGLACILGHVLSPFLRGRGGKGVATTFGAVIAVFPWFALPMALVFALIVWRMRWVAAASMAAAGLLVVLSLVGPMPPPVSTGRLWGVVVGLLVIARHRRNVQGWLSGRFG